MAQPREYTVPVRFRETREGVADVIVTATSRAEAEDNALSAVWDVVFSRCSVPTGRDAWVEREEKTHG
jgi:hypothetical protein